MAIPLQKALLGEDGVFYGAAYVAVFNLVLWSYGVMAMSGDRKALSARRLLLNPGVIGLAAGLLLFFTGIRLPAFLEAPVGHLAALNTPLPMLIVGFYLADADLKSAVRNKRLIASMGLRLLAVPLLTPRPALPLRHARRAPDRLRDRRKRAGRGSHHHVCYPVWAGCPALCQSRGFVDAMFDADDAAGGGAAKALGG